jgi:hypothetical protein
MGEWSYRSTILDLSTILRWVVSFTPLLLYPWGKNPQYPMDRRLGRPQGQSGCCGKEKYLALLRIKHWSSSQSPVANTD